MPPPESADARTRAHQILTQLAAEGPGASSRDPERGLAGAIVRTTVRRWLTIRHLIRQAGQRDPDTLEPVVCASVLGGVAELVCLDGTPDPIVVDAHVESIRPYRPGATKLVNAILRRVIDLRGEPIEQADFADPSHIPLGAGHGWQLSEPISLPGDDPLAILAVRSGMPRGLIRRWAREQGLEEATRGAWHGVMQAPVVIQDIEPEQAEQLGLLAHVEPNAYVLPREANPAEIIEATGGRIQDVGSARAVDFALDLEPTTILDPCAGGGTKTDQMRRRFPNAHITAWDPDQERQDRLRRRFSQDEGVTVTSRPPEGTYDLVLLDVPCSNSGVLARRPMARHRFGPRALADLEQLQEEILHNWRPAVAPQGHLLWSTCSLEPEENEQFLERRAPNLQLELVRRERTLPAGLPGEPNTVYRDGGTVTLLRGSE